MRVKHQLHLLQDEIWWQPKGCMTVVQVTWVSMIICILFFETSLANALWTGLIVGILYTLFVRAMYRHQLAVVRR